MSSSQPLTRHFDSARLYRSGGGSLSAYLLGFCAFIFMLTGGALLILHLWRQTGILSGFAYTEFYLLLRPVQVFLALTLAVIVLASALIVRMACGLLLEQNRMTLQLLLWLGAENHYLIRSFDRFTFRRDMSGIILGAALGGVFLWGFRFYLSYSFATISSALPGIPWIDFWFLFLLLLTLCIYGILLRFESERAIRIFLR